MQNTDNKRFVAIGLMLFAILFGAGNLIFPASMGQASGDHFVWAFIGFCITGVGLPLLAIIAMAYAGCNDLQEAAGRAHPLYGLFYTVVVYMSIGPCFAIPRTGTVAFEIGLRPFLTEGQVEMGLWIFLVLFFVVSYWLAATPQKLVDRVGKILTPALVLTLGALIVKSVVDPLGVPQAAQPNYAGVLTATVAGILDGYNTLDAIAAFVFATLVTNFVREGGAKTAKEVTSQVYKSGILAVSLLAVIYFFIAKIGADSVTPLGILVLLYLAFICGAGYLLWALLMKNNPVSRIAIFGFVNPVVNVLLSAVLNGEPLFRWQYLAALVFVCVGIWLVNKAPAKKEKQ